MFILHYMKHDSQQILALKASGLTYLAIAQKLGCSINVVKYHAVPDRAEKQNQQTKTKNANFKKEFGGKCYHCGYNRSLSALHFHHKNPQEKAKDVSYFLHRNSLDLAREEAKKCILLCANCHAELHDNLWTL